MENSLISYKKAPISTTHIRLYIAMILGQITCGYGLGITGTALGQLPTDIHINGLWQGLLGAGSLFGLAGSALMGRLADEVGRRKMLMLNMYLLALFSLAQVLTTNLVVLLGLRVLIGLMIAIDYTVGNALLVEWLPANKGGKFQSKLIIYWTVGFILAYFAGIIIHTTSSHNWQFLLASAAFWGLVTAIYRTAYPLPASPAWLANQGRTKVARNVVQKHLGKRWGLPLWMRQKQPQNQVTWRLLFSPRYRRQTVVGGLFYASQAFAFFGISIFLPLLLMNLHLNESNISGLIYNGCLLIGVLVGGYVFRVVRRRSFLIGTFLLAAVALLAMVLLRRGQPTVQIILFGLFAVILSAGLVLDYPYPTELFDDQVRASGVGLCITISRFGAASGTFLLPVITAGWGVYWAMLVCVGALVFGGLVCWGWAPETSPRFK